MNAMKNKIKSQRGASITFALLLFLVCAVVSGVVIVAATAASGRMDQIAEYDQRYFAVTSAAELLKDALDEKTVVVETVETSTVTRLSDGNEKSGTRTYNKASKMYFDAEKKSTPIELTATSVAALTVLGDAAYRVANAAFVPMSGVNSVDVTDYLVVDESDLSEMPRTMKLTATATNAEVANALAVDIREDARPNGIITFYVSKVDAKDSTKSYTLKLSFKADVKTDVDVQTKAETPTNVTNGASGLSYETRETTTISTVTTMTWTLTGIVKSV